MSMNKICSLWTYYVFCLAGILLISCTEDEVAGTPFITISNSLKCQSLSSCFSIVKPQLCKSVVSSIIGLHIDLY